MLEAEKKLMKPYWKQNGNKIYQGDALEVLRTMPKESIHCVVTSPPYWGLRDYGIEGQLGLEKTPEEYIEKMVEIFREVRRVLRSDGSLWLNLGSSMWGGKGKSSQAWSTKNQNRTTLQKGQHQICSTGETRPADNNGANDMMELRDDLTPEEIAYVLHELSCDISGKEQQGFQEHD